MPNPDEVAALDAYVRSGKDVSALSDPERMLLQLIGLPNCEARLRIYSYKFTCPYKLQSAKQVWGRPGVCEGYPCSAKQVWGRPRGC